MTWSVIARAWALGALVVPAALQAQTVDSSLPVSLERIRAALEQPPPILRLPASSRDLPTFRIEVRQPRSVLQPVEEETFDPTLGLPSAGQLLMGGIEKVRSALVGYKRGRAARRVRREVDEALAAFCAAHECPATNTQK
jgi:hypothetical protein